MAAGLRRRLLGPIESPNLARAIAANEEVRQHLEVVLLAHPDRAVAIINWFLEKPSDAELFVKDRYESITRFASAQILLDALQKEYGQRLNTQDSGDERLELAQAFVWLCSKYTGAVKSAS